MPNPSVRNRMVEDFSDRLMYRDMDSFRMLPLARTLHLIQYTLKSLSRELSQLLLPFVYSRWSRFDLDVTSQETGFLCSRSLAPRSALRSFASLQSA